MLQVPARDAFQVLEWTMSRHVCRPRCKPGSMLELDRPRSALTASALSQV
jgi:hypothetical protein